VVEGVLQRLRHDLRPRAHMHLDTVFTMLDRDKVTLFPAVGMNELNQTEY
jgi:arginine deiminase